MSIILANNHSISAHNSITWADSSIRWWFTNIFINTAFTAEEKSKIIDSNVPAHANPSYNTSPGNSTTDKIFLLSITEANQYFTSDNDRRAATTPYVKAKGAKTGSYTDFQYSSNWWLRSPGRDTSRAANVSSVGSISYYGDYVDLNDIAVRPALWVNF